MSTFFALDVETANADYSSICQIGIAEFNNGVLKDSWETLVNPQDYFDWMNISIHGITEEMVKQSPTFPDLYQKIKEIVEDNIVVHHMPFDRIAINRACELNGFEHFRINWLDSAKVVRRTWGDFAYSGYGLSKITNYLGITFNHHNALEDAVAAGKVMIRAIEKSGIELNEWIPRVKNPINVHEGGSSSVKLEGNPEGPLYGENIVFTGTLYITRAEAAKIAADLGCNVSNSVTKKTSLLVVGTQDDFKLASYSKSSKHRKAEELFKKGNDIRILSEDDFKSLTNE